MIPVLPAMKCNDIKCKLLDHRHQIDTLYSQICCSLKQSSIDSIPSSKVHDCRDYIVPGFNDLRRSYTVLLVMPMLPGGMPVGHGLDLFVVI